jgi:UDP-GlcNAc:undecaprenyl-phosphate/decaprenyl-phosphate GlcNAc-1-phosphate transferase
LERRSFLNFQMAIQNSKDIEEMWGNLSRALQWLNFDLMELRIDDKNNQNSQFLWWNKQRSDDDDENNWNEFLKRETLMKLELPLTSNNNTYGTLWLVKDLKREPLSHYTIRRIEHLRRTIIKTIEKIG